MEEDIIKFQEASKALEPDSDEREVSEYKVWQFLNQSYEELPFTPAWNSKIFNPQSELAIGPARSIDELLGHYDKNIVKSGGNLRSGRFMAYVSGGGLFSAALAEFITSSSNIFSALNFVSPGAVQMENQVIDWIIKEFGLPDTALGNICYSKVSEILEHPLYFAISNDIGYIDT